MAVASPPKTYRRPPTRVPLPYPDENGIQVNACQNFKCSNFGVPVDPAYKPIGMAAHGHKDRYKIGMTAGPKLLIHCNVCGAHHQVRSNRGIYEEMVRQMKYLLKPALSCPNPKCENHFIAVGDGTKHYHTHHQTRAGSLRYRCKKCGKTFSQKRTATLGQRKPKVNARALDVFLSGVTFWKMTKRTLKLAPSTLYGKLDFFYRQFQAFAASREKRFLDDKPLLVADPKHPDQKLDVLRRLYVSVDQLFISVNWSSKKDQRVT